MARKALLVGAGGMGQTWAKNLTAHPDLVEIAGWVDIRENAATIGTLPNEKPTLINEG